MECNILLSQVNCWPSDLSTSSALCTSLPCWCTCVEQLPSHFHDWSLLSPKSSAHKRHSFGHHKRSPILIPAWFTLLGFSLTCTLSQLSVAKSQIKAPAAQSFSFSVDKLWGNMNHKFQSPPFLAVGCCYASGSSWLKTVPTYSYAVHKVLM